MQVESRLDVPDAGQVEDGTEHDAGCRIGDYGVETQPSKDTLEPACRYYDQAYRAPGATRAIQPRPR